MIPIPPCCPNQPYAPVQQTSSWSQHLPSISLLLALLVVANLTCCRGPSFSNTVVHRPLGPAPTTTKGMRPHSHVSTADPLLLRHQHVVSTAVLGTLDRLQPGAGWSMVAPSKQQHLQLPTMDYSLTNSALLPQLCHLLGQVWHTSSRMSPTSPTPKSHINPCLVCQWLPTPLSTQY